MFGGPDNWTGDLGLEGLEGIGRHGLCAFTATGSKRCGMVTLGTGCVTTCRFGESILVNKTVRGSDSTRGAPQLWQKVAAQKRASASQR